MGGTILSFLFLQVGGCIFTYHNCNAKRPALYSNITSMHVEAEAATLNPCIVGRKEMDEEEKSLWVRKWIHSSNLASWSYSSWPIGQRDSIRYNLVICLFRSCTLSPLHKPPTDGPAHWTNLNLQTIYKNILASGLEQTVCTTWICMPMRRQLLL